MHNSLDAALADFQAAGAAGPATLCTTPDPRVAVHVAASHSIQEATALAQAEAVIHSVSSINSGGIPRADLRAQLVAQLGQALQDLAVNDDTEHNGQHVIYGYDSDNEYWRDS
jgi:hypothetical protein